MDTAKKVIEKKVKSSPQEISRRKTTADAPMIKYKPLPHFHGGCKNC